MSTENHTVFKDLVVRNKIGIHARPASKIVKAASAFEADVMFQKDDITANGKSMLELMTLAAANGERLTVRATGSDAAEAMAAIEALFSSNFDEE